MHRIKKIAFSLLALSIAACATERAAPLPDTPVPAVTSRPKPRSVGPVPITDAEQGLRTAILAYQAGNSNAALLAARSVGEQYPDTFWYKRSLFVVEQAFIQADRPSDADAAMLRVRAEYPEMADYALSLLADYHYAGRRFTQAAALYQDLVDAYPKSSLAARAAFRTGQSLLEAYAFSQAAQHLEAFFQNKPRSELAADAGVGLGLALLALGRIDDAVGVYRDVWMKYPGTAADQEAVKALAMLSGSGIAVAAWTGEELYERGRNLFRTAQYDKTVDAFGKLLEVEPKTSRRAEALLRTGISQYNLGKRGDSALMLERLVSEYPGDERAAEALYWLGRSYSKLGDRERAVKTFQKLLSRHPDSEWADDGLFVTGNIYREAGEMKKALTFYGRLSSEYPDSRFADSSIWWMAWSLYSAGEYGKADQKLQELVNRYPRSFLVNQARYWQGRIAERTGSPEKAAAYYAKVQKHGTYTYYGYRAAERLARPGGEAKAVVADPVVQVSAACEDPNCSEDPLASFDTDDGPPVWSEETRQLLTTQPSFRKTLELMHLEMRKEAAAELWYLQDRLPRKQGSADRAVQGLLRTGRLLPLAAPGAPEL